MVLKLPRLNASAIVGSDGKPSREFTRAWNELTSSIETAFNQLADAVAGIEAAQEEAEAASTAASGAQTAADSAQTAAIGAQTAADNAQTSADSALTAAGSAQTAADNAQAAADAAASAAGGVGSVVSLTNSYPLEDCTLTGKDAGSNAVIVISAHTRRYGDGTEVSVNGGVVGSLSYNSFYYVYYDDAARAGGAVSYAAVGVASKSDAFYSAAHPDRHFVGTCNTPVALDPDLEGTPAVAPGEP